MRTTLTLDADVAAAVDREMRRTGESLKTTVNGLLRSGLTRPKAIEKPFVVEARNMGLRSGMSFDNIGALIELLEGPAHS